MVNAFVNTVRFGGDVWPILRKAEIILDYCSTFLKAKSIMARVCRAFRADDLQAVLDTLTIRDMVEGEWFLCLATVRHLKIYLDKTKGLDSLTVFWAGGLCDCARRDPLQQTCW